MRIFNYTVIFKPLDEGGYDVIVPAIPEICTFGETIEEAREMVEDAIKCYIESAIELNETIPVDREIFSEKIAVKVAS
ncbi:TPA: type II toxin-antitoxin system HicB family antitoxin [Candidatus Poribacteria bacterium]|nr:type II toxin-antitoxin system HicB family antitoxin [Candidatus Poribacteria bacterium]